MTSFLSPSPRRFSLFPQSLPLLPLFSLTRPHLSLILLQLPVLVRLDGFVAVARVLGIGLGLSAEASEVLRLAEEEVKSVKEERSSELLRAKLASVRSQLHVRESERGD